MSKSHSHKHQIDIGKRGLTVYVKNNDLNKALRKLKKLVQDEGLLQDVRKNEFYEQPSTRRRRERAMAVKRWRKRELEINEQYGL